MGIISGGSAVNTTVLGGHVLDYAEFTANVSIVSTSEAAPTVLVTGAAVTYNGTTKILLEAYVPCLNATNAVVSLLAFYEDGVSLGFAQRDSIAVAYGTGVDTVSRPLARRLTPTAGSHTYSLGGWNGAAGTIVAKAAAGGAGFFLPGFIRVTVEA